MSREGEVDGRWGQIHDREIGAGERPPLTCLHATVCSIRTFVPLTPRLRTTRRVIAIDTRDYCESDAPAAYPSRARDAEAIVEGVTRLVGNLSVDLFGDHTGVSLADQMATGQIDVRCLAPIDIAFFAGDEHATWRAACSPSRTPDSPNAGTSASSTGRPASRRSGHSTVSSTSASPIRATGGRTTRRSTSRWLRDCAPSGNRRRSSRRRPRSAKLRAGSDGLHRAAVVELPELSGTIFDLGTERPAPTIDAFLTRA